MAKFKFSIEAGIFYRKKIKNMLQISANKLMYDYPGSNVTITEKRGFLESTFFIQGINFPDEYEFQMKVKNWINKIKQLEN